MSIKIVPVEQGGIIKIITSEPEAGTGTVPKPTPKPDQKKGFFADPAIKIAIAFLLIALAILGLLGMDGKSTSGDSLRQVAGSIANSAINKMDQNVDIKVNEIKNNDVPMVGYYYYKKDSGIVYCFKEVVK